MTPAEQLEELVDLDSSVYRLSAWEVEFVDSVEKQTRAGRSLTQRQEQVISNIWDAVFIHGKRHSRDD